jgi:hypothetical protein
MSVVIVGGHDRMVCQYKDICREYKCDAKVYTQPKGNLESMIGTPGLIILFTNPVAHTMAKAARNRAAQNNIPLIQSHCGSGNALRCILETSLAAK